MTDLINKLAALRAQIIVLLSASAAALMLVAVLHTAWEAWQRGGVPDAQSLLYIAVAAAAVSWGCR